MRALKTAPYRDQQARWPRSGKHILAQHDESTIVVYQAYKPSIADFAAQHGRFGGDFSYSRMSWVKPNFLWMMHRCGWCTKQGQERVLAVRLPVLFFDWLLSEAVQSTFDGARFATKDDWQEAIRRSSVRLQWDPDHNPSGERLERRAIQLGLRGDALRRYGQEESLEITDVTSFVAEQRPRRTDPQSLVTPLESVYTPTERAVCAQIGLDAWDSCRHARAIGRGKSD